MEARDTVVSLADLIVKTIDIEIMALGSRDECIKALRKHLLTQAEITWKAREPEIAEARKAGFEDAISSSEGLFDTFIGELLKVERARILQYLKSLLQSNPKASLAETLALIEVSKPDEINPPFSP